MKTNSDHYRRGIGRKKSQKSRKSDPEEGSSEYGVFNRRLTQIYADGGKRSKTDEPNREWRIGQQPIRQAQGDSLPFGRELGVRISTLNDD
jgi:hypothetical protein